MFTHSPEDESWLHSKWLALMALLEVDRTAADSTWVMLAQHYSEPHRAYHNLCHVTAMLRHADQLPAQISQPDIVEFAIWFHDAIYDTHNKDNERRSAELALYTLHSMGIDPCIATSVEQCILATHKHEVGDTPAADLPLFLDIDLAILGAREEVYRQYCQAIRAEYAWVAPDAYRAGRAEVLKHFLDRPSLFFTPTMIARFEDQARHNIERELGELLSS